MGKKKAAKKQGKKYEPKLQVNANFVQVIQAAAKDANSKTPEPKK